MSSSENDSEDDFKPSGSRAKGTKRKKSQKKRPCGKKARKDIIDRIDISLYFFYHQNEDDTDDVKLHEINRKVPWKSLRLCLDEIQNNLLIDPDYDEHDERLQLQIWLCGIGMSPSLPSFTTVSLVM